MTRSLFKLIMHTNNKLIFSFGFRFCGFYMKQIRQSILFLTQNSIAKRSVKLQTYKYDIFSKYVRNTLLSQIFTQLRFGLMMQEDYLRWNHYAYEKDLNSFVSFAVQGLCSLVQQQEQPELYRFQPLLTFCFFM